MLIRFHRVLLLFVAVLFFAAVSGQMPGLQELDSLAGRYVKALRSMETESLYLQTDRPVYRTGEMVWYKAFLLNALSGKPSRQGSMVFVDMVDEHDRVINQALLNAADFKTDGSFVLPDTLISGHYWLRAYTKRSLQNADESMYVQALYVMNSLKPDPDKGNRANTATKISADDSVRVQFFPEGGTVVGGANTMLVAKTTDAKGNPVQVTGFVKDDQDSLLAELKTGENGLGKLAFFCRTWHQYRLHIQVEKGKRFQYVLPPVNLFAAQLAVTEKNGIRKLRVVLEDSIFRRDKLTYVLGISGDSLCFSGVGRGSYELVIPEYRFPKGVAHFVLFDEATKLLSERSLYIEGTEPTVTIETDKPSYLAREQVHLTVKVSGADKQPEVAAFMVEVNDATRDAFYEPIKVKNPVPMPANPMATAGKYPAEAMDTWLLTQHNRYTTEIVKRMKMPVVKDLMADSSLYIQGRVTDARQKPLPQKIVTLFGDAKEKIFLTDTTDVSGRFSFPFTAYNDKTRFNLQVTDFSGRLQEAKILLDTLLHIPKPVTPSRLKYRFVQEEIEIARKVLIQQTKDDTVMVKRGKEWLKDVTVKGLIKKDPGYDTKKRMSLFSKIIPSDVLQRSGAGSLGNAIFRAPGIHLRNGYVTVQGGNGFQIGAATEPMLVLDGIPIPSDTSDKISGSEPSPVLMALNRIDPSSVDFIEVLTGPEAAIYGVRGGNGVIIVNTKSRLLSDDPGKTNGIRNLELKGFHVPEVFEQRDYSVKENRQSKIPDLRSLVYWNGDGLTDAAGKASLSFYTADAATTYRVTITGITAHGYRFQQQMTILRK